MRRFDPTFEPKGMVGLRRLGLITRSAGDACGQKSLPWGPTCRALARRYGLRPQQVYALATGRSALCSGPGSEVAPISTGHRL